MSLFNLKYKWKLIISVVWPAALFLFFLYYNYPPLKNIIYPLPVIIFMGAAVLGPGLKVVNKFKFKRVSFLDKIIFSSGLGLGFAYIAAIFMGLAGLYGKVPLLLVCASLIGFSWREIKEVAVELGTKIRLYSGKRLSVEKASFLFILTASLGIAFLISFSPSVSRSSLEGPLNSASYYFAEGKIVPIDYNYASNLPSGMSVLQATTLTLAGPSGVRLLSFLFLLLLSGGVYSMTRNFFRRRIALFSTSVLLSTPALISFYLTDHSFTGSVFFAFLSLYSYMFFSSEVDRVESVSGKWVALSGAFAGLSLSFGFYCMFVPMALLAMIIYSLYSHKREAIFQRSVDYTGRFLIPFIATLIPMGFKNILFTGGFFFPFFSTSVPGFGFLAVGDSLWGELMPLWNIPFLDRASLENFYLMGPLFILFSPACAFVKKMGKTVKVLGMFIIIYILLYAGSGRSVGYIYFLIPVLSVITSYVIVNFYGKRKFLFRFIMLLFFAGIFFNFYTILGESRGSGSLYYALGIQSRQDYLKRNLEGYHAFEYINSEIPEESRVLLASVSSAFYVQRKVISPDGFIEPVREMVRRGFVEEVERLGVTHILFRENFNRYWERYDSFIFNSILEKKARMLFEKNGYFIYEFL